MAKITLNVDGKSHTIDADPDMPLLYALRDDIGLNNPHFGCGLAQCGACTVHLNGQPIRSCVTPVSAVGDGKVVTHGRPRHAREAAPAADRLCRGAGAAVRLLHQRLGHDRGRVPATTRRSRPTPRSSRRCSGLKCRCGTHMNIMRAVKRAADDDGLREAIMTKMEKASTLLPPLDPQGRRRTGGLDRHADRRRRPCSASTPAHAQGTKPPLTPDQLSSYVAINADGTVSAFFGKMDMGQGLFTRHRPDGRRRARRSVQERQGDHGRHRHQREPGRRVRLDRHPVRRQADARGRRPKRGAC